MNLTKFIAPRRQARKERFLLIPKSAVKIYDIEEAKKKERGSECLG
jgi:hypothetical protein